MCVCVCVFAWMGIIDYYMDKPLGKDKMCGENFEPADNITVHLVPREYLIEKMIHNY